MNRRGSGILLHLTSLPSAFGVGDLGTWAYRFADFLVAAHQRYWQVLPLNPTDGAHGNSPYHSISAFAINPLLISPELMVHEGLLPPGALDDVPSFPRRRVDFSAVSLFKKDLFRRDCERLESREQADGYFAFCGKHGHWLEDYALFCALKERYNGQAWCEWPRGLRDRDPEALASARKENERVVERVKRLQYIAFRQWEGFRGHCRDRGIQLIGDVPIYVVHDSADTWKYPHLFKLDEVKRPFAVAGVPPDYFSDTGQLWGNPVYRWDVMKQEGYAWWIQRIAHNLDLFDMVRVDHFRGFVAYWEVAAGESEAVNGRWVEAPARDFFSRLTEVFPRLPLIAEDLGVITPDVTEVMEHFGFPGMRVLLFAFGDDRGVNPYLPHNHTRNCVVYTGTHDNNTARGWFEGEATTAERRYLTRYLGRDVLPETLPWELIRMAMMSVADRVVFPMQDLLALGEESRMNRPARKRGNWEWRLVPEALTPVLMEKLGEVTRIYGRGFV